MVQAAFGGDVFVMKQHVGLFRRIKKIRGVAEENGAVYKIGVDGICDIGGWVSARPWPMPFQIEVKTGFARPNNDQLMWRGACLKWGIFHRVLHFSGRWCDEDTRIVEKTITELRSACSYQKP
jgi:hypothetical protein